LGSARATLADAGRACGVAVLPIGTAPVRHSSAAAPAISGRHAVMHDRYREMTREYDVCGLHVHVGVDDADLAVAVVNHLRPWLPTLLAVGGNSPFHAGRDSGYSSWRTAEQARFPGSGLPPFARSADDYDDELAKLVECGVLVDKRTSFWLARPSQVFPTVEVRAADAAATVDDAVLQAVLTRGLVRSALRRLDSGIEGPHIDEQVGAAAVWSAARHGLTGAAVDPIEETQVPAVHLLGALVAWIADDLEEVGDLALAQQLLATVQRHGTGAARQRVAARLGMRDLVDALALNRVSSPTGLLETEGDFRPADGMRSATAAG
jgi:carboxylate-amine ligase